MDAPAVIASIPLGLLVGTMLTMIIDRVPDDLPVCGRPRCPLCEHHLRPIELVPVLSWIGQRGRCRYCGEHLTVAYPLVEIVTAASFAIATARFHTWWVIVPFWLFFAMLVTVSTVDIFRYRIPDRVVFPTLLVSFVAIVVVSQHVNATSAISRAVLGAVLFSGVLFVLSVMPGGGMGFGDVKLALVLGLFLGWLPGDVSGVEPASNVNEPSTNRKRLNNTSVSESASAPRTKSSLPTTAPPSTHRLPDPASPMTRSRPTFFVEASSRSTSGSAKVSRVPCNATVTSVLSMSGHHRHVRRPNSVVPAKSAASLIGGQVAGRSARWRATASRIASTGAAWPVHHSNWPAA